MKATLCRSTTKIWVQYVVYRVQRDGDQKYKARRANQFSNIADSRYWCIVAFVGRRAEVGWCGILPLSLGMKHFAKSESSTVDPALE